MLETKVVALGEVNGDDVAVEILAGGLEGLFVGGSESEKVAVGLEVTDTEVLSRVGEDEGYTAEDLHACWYGEREW
jgi:hypothetical protein